MTELVKLTIRLNICNGQKMKWWKYQRLTNNWERLSVNCQTIFKLMSKNCGIINEKRLSSKFGKIGGKFLRFFILHFGSRYLCNKNSDKMSAICIHFCKLIDCEMCDQIFNSGSKMFDKLFATTCNFFEILGEICFFLSNNCLTRVQVSLSNTYVLMSPRPSTDSSDIIKWPGQSKELKYTEIQ
jgi:hypothetical protein